MIIHYETNFLTKDNPPKSVAATIGFFDGVHKGHKYLLNRLSLLAHDKNATSMVVTFANHPREVFNPEFPVSLLSTYDEKIELIENAGIDKCIMLYFDRSLAKLTSKEFLQILSEKYDVKYLIVGYDHHFGSDTESSIEDYKYYGSLYGIEVILENVLLENEIDVSSSKIRKALQGGVISMANSYLGYTFSLSGKVVSGKKLGRTLGFPTANILLNEKKIVPKHGVYAVKVEIEEGVFYGMLNIGNRPTVNGDSTTFEVHIIDYSGDLYGKTIRIFLYDYIREEHKFNSKEALQSQLKQDKIDILHYFSVEK